MVPEKLPPANPKAGATMWLAVITAVATSLRLLLELVRTIR